MSDPPPKPAPAGPSPGPPSASGPAPTGKACGGRTPCDDNEVELVEVKEIVTFGGTSTVQDVPNFRKQYINLDDQVDTSTAHPEYGRRIRLQARIKWVRGDRKGNLNTHHVYWRVALAVVDQPNLSGGELWGFCRKGSSDPKERSVFVSDTDANGFTEVDFYLSQYGGDGFMLQAGDKPAFSGVVKSGGAYQVWRKFWYQLTQMKDETGSPFVLPGAVINDFEKAYKDVFIELEEDPASSADPSVPKERQESLDHTANLADDQARANATAGHFSKKKHCPFKAHITTVDYSQLESEHKFVDGYMTAAKWVSPGSPNLLWRFDSGTDSDWKVKGRYCLSTSGPPWIWKDIPPEKIGKEPNPTNKHWMQVSVDFTDGPVKPSVEVPVYVSVEVKVAGPIFELGWGGGNHHLFLCMGTLHDTQNSADWDLLMGNTCVHELGHALGLVNIKPNAPGSQSWEDQDSTHQHKANHCKFSSSDCVMFWEVFSSGVTKFHLDGGAGCRDYIRRQDFSRSVMGHVWVD